MTHQDKQKIFDKWTPDTYVEKIDYTLIWQIAIIAFLTISGILYSNYRLKNEIMRRITLQKEVNNANKSLTDSIEFASLIQQAFIPKDDIFKTFFDDHFLIWEPRDIVSGDIYSFNKLRSDDEIIIMLIDCTGHGVAGAFVTMLVKAIERQIISDIINSDDIVSPAKILNTFNKNLKNLLKQHDKSSISNSGFDAGVIYINRSQSRVVYAGANIPLFYIKEGVLKTIRGDRHSIGYKTSDVNYHFTDHVIMLDKSIYFYITTDGYIDQNGGEKSFPMGKTKFKKLIEQNFSEPMQIQKEKLLNQLQSYQGLSIRNDDVTLIGFKIDKEDLK